jgi:hypothetical protein
LHLAPPARMIHCAEQGDHDLSQTIRFRGIDPIV